MSNVSLGVSGSRQRRGPDGRYLTSRLLTVTGSLLARVYKLERLFVCGRVGYLAVSIIDDKSKIGGSDLVLG